MHQNLRSRTYSLTSLMALVTFFAVILAISRWLNFPVLAAGGLFIGSIFWLAGRRFEMPMLFVVGDFVMAAALIGLAATK